MERADVLEGNAKKGRGMAKKEERWLI